MEAKQLVVEAEAKAEGVAPVEAAAVEAKAAPEPEKPVNLSEQADKAVDRVAALTGERDALAVEIAELRTARDKTAEAMTGLTAERDELAGKLTKAEADLSALKAERDEACRKLAAIEAGASPVSAAPAPEVPAESAWKKAQKAAKQR